MDERIKKGIYGAITSWLVAYAIMDIVAVLIWLLSPEGQHFNENTIPLATALKILAEVVFSIWTWILAGILWIPVTNYELWDIYG